MVHAGRNVILSSFLFIHRGPRIFRLFSQRGFRSLLASFPLYYLPPAFSGKNSRMEGRKRGEKVKDGGNGRTGPERERANEGGTCVASLHKSAITKLAITISKQLPFLVINSPNPCRSINSTVPGTVISYFVDSHSVSSRNLSAGCSFTLIQKRSPPVLS